MSQYKRVTPTGQPVSSSPSATETAPEVDRTIIVTTRGQFDLSPRSMLALTLAQGIVAGRREVIVDLEVSGLIDPDDVGLLVRARSLLRSRGQHLVVLSPAVPAAVIAACVLVDPLAIVGRG